MEKNKGLTTKQAEKLLAKYGLNEIKGKARKTPLQIFLEQFTSILVILLIVATIASFFLGEVIDAIFILLILILNAILGFIQEYRAEKAIEALKKITVSKVRAIRDGTEQEIDSKLLVPGDIIILAEGDKIPADAKLIEAVHFETDEAALTGESMPVNKQAGNPDKNQIYLGTIVARGRGKALVTKTGMDTRFGKIAASLAEIEEEKTPLAKKIDTLGKQLGFLAVCASLIVFVFGLITKFSFSEMILTSISLAVASVPEGLPAVITITLAIGMQRMAKQKAVVRKLAAVEALGSATVIATDKTGTLTENKMKVTKLWLAGKQAVLNTNNHRKISEFLNKGNLNKLLTVAVLCNNASISYKHGSDDYTILGDPDVSSYSTPGVYISDDYTILGDPTEGALLLMATDYGWQINEVKQTGKLTEEFPFDPKFKSMTVIWQFSQPFKELPAGFYVFTKGAPETILAKSSKILHQGKIVPLNWQDKKQIDKEFRKFADEGLRVIAFAYRPSDSKEKSREQAEEDLIFIGFVGIADPPRKEIPLAIKQSEQAGIRTIMITGDNELTARTVASQIGLIKKDEQVLTGKLLDNLTDKQLLTRLDKIRIYARTTPEHKLRLVRLLQKKGETVAVTGDGVNDALALKQADIGIAMGITGTDVAKEAADMVITDDNYATIVKAVAEGRTIFDNIKAAVKYLIGCNIGEIIAILGGMIIGVYLDWPIILTPLQILYVNLVTDGLPALALAVQPKRENIMSQKPRRNKSIFDSADKYWFLEVSPLTGLATIISFYIGWQIAGSAVARTLSFTTLVLVQPFIFVDIWARKKSFIQSIGAYKNKMFILAFFLPFIIQPFLIYHPTLAAIFKITPVPIWLFVLTVSLSGIVLFSSEMRKMLLKSKSDTSD